MDEKKLQTQDLGPIHLKLWYDAADIIAVDGKDD